MKISNEHAKVIGQAFHWIYIFFQQLYDHLMNYLEERGVSEEFADKLSGVCSDYEHSLYVGLLEKLQAFVHKK